MVSYQVLLNLMLGEFFCVKFQFLSDPFGGRFCEVEKMNDLLAGHVMGSTSVALIVCLK